MDEASNRPERRVLIHRLPRGRYVLVYDEGDDDVCLYRIGRAQIDRSVTPKRKQYPLTYEGHKEMLRDKGIDTRSRAERFRDKWISPVDDDFRTWKSNRGRHS